MNDASTIPDIINDDTPVALLKHLKEDRGTLTYEGRIAVTNRTDSVRLRELAEIPTLTLDVTKLDLGRLPENIKANLYSDARRVVLSNVRTSGSIDAPKARYFDAPKLEKVSGGMNVYSARAVTLPNLHSVSRGINAYSAAYVSLPDLTEASGGIRADHATAITAPKIKPTQDGTRYFNIYVHGDPKLDVPSDSPNIAVRKINELPRRSVLQALRYTLNL